MNRIPKRPVQIALFTDFGSGGPYTGQMLATLASSPVPVLELLSDAPPFDPRGSAYLLAALAGQLPRDTLVLAVVDPGVGGARDAIVVRTAEHWFVGPDNGLLSQLIRSEGVEVQRIDWRPQHLSASFHGRDLFAPVGLMLCRGEEVPGEVLNPALTVGYDWPADLDRVIYVDRYGNLITGRRAAGLPEESRLAAGGRTLRHARTFCEVPPGTPFWYANAFGLVEIAVNQGSAAGLTGLGPGDPVELLPKD